MPYNENEVEQTLEFLLKKLEISREEFDRALHSANKSFHDYPSYNFIFTKMMKIAKPVLSLVFLHKPQSIFQAEMRKKK